TRRSSDLGCATASDEEEGSPGRRRPPGMRGKPGRREAHSRAGQLLRCGGRQQSALPFLYGDLLQTLGLNGALHHMRAGCSRMGDHLDAESPSAVSESAILALGMSSPSQTLKPSLSLDEVATT